MDIEKVNELRKARDSHVQAIEHINAEILTEMAPFKVGDTVIDRGKMCYQISEITMDDDPELGTQFKYFGYLVRQDGSVSDLKLPVYQMPLSLFK